MLSIVGGGIQRLSATVYIAVSFFPLPLCFFFFFLFLSARPVLGVLRFVSHWILEKFLVRRWLLSCKKTFFFFFLERLNSTLRKASAGCWNVVVV